MYNLAFIYLFIDGMVQPKLVSPKVLESLCAKALMKQSAVRLNNYLYVNLFIIDQKVLKLNLQIKKVLYR